MVPEVDDNDDCGRLRLGATTVVAVVVAPVSVTPVPVPVLCAPVVSTTLVTAGNVTVRPTDADADPEVPLLYGSTAPLPKRRKRSANTSGHGGSGIRKIFPPPVNGSTNSGFPYAAAPAAPAAPAAASE